VAIDILWRIGGSAAAAHNVGAVLKMRILSLVIACAAVSAAGASDRGLELAPPDTKAVFGLRVKGIAESALFKDAAVRRR
jgi:hypothetical protein